MSPKQKLSTHSAHPRAEGASRSVASRVQEWLGHGRTSLHLIRLITRSLFASGDGFVTASGNSLLAPGEIELAAQNVERLLD